MNYCYSNINHEMAQVAIPQSLLEQLITDGLLHGSDCHCLNAIAKTTVWKSLLSNSLSTKEAD